MPTSHSSLRRKLAAIPFAIALLVLVACGAEGPEPSDDGDAEQEPTETTASGTGAAEEPPRMPENPPPAPEPAEAPPLEGEPAGEVVEVGGSLEGIVADPETGLVAAGMRDGSGLALIDGESGELARIAELPGRARHLDLAAPGGPVLVPVERANAFLQVGLPDGDIVEETPVGDFPHDAAAYEGRIFVLNEFESTAAVIEAGEVVETFETPFQPGGVAVTDDGIVGIVGVRGLAVEFYEADTLESSGRLEGGEGPTHIVAGSDERFYVTDTRGDALLVYEAAPEPEMVERVPLDGGSPYGIAIDREREELWVTLVAENRVVRYDVGGGSPEETGSYPTVRQPNTVAVNPESGRVFIAGAENGDLQLLDP